MSDADIQTSEPAEAAKTTGLAKASTELPSSSPQMVESGTYYLDETGGEPPQKMDADFLNRVLPRNILDSFNEIDTAGDPNDSMSIKELADCAKLYLKAVKKIDYDVIRLGWAVTYVQKVTTAAYYNAGHAFTIIRAKLKQTKQWSKWLEQNHFSRNTTNDAIAIYEGAGSKAIAELHTLKDAKQLWGYKDNRENHHAATSKKYKDHQKKLEQRQKQQQVTAELLERAGEIVNEKQISIEQAMKVATEERAREAPEMDIKTRVQFIKKTNKNLDELFTVFDNKIAPVSGSLSACNIILEHMIETNRMPWRDNVPRCLDYIKKIARQLRTLRNQYRKILDTPEKPIEIPPPATPIIL